MDIGILTSMYFKYNKDHQLKFPHILLGLYSPDYSLLIVASKNYALQLFFFPFKSGGFVPLSQSVGPSLDCHSFSSIAIRILKTIFDLESCISARLRKSNDLNKWINLLNFPKI